MITVKDVLSYGDNISISNEEGNTVYSFKYPCENYSVCNPFEIAFSPGFYFLECWGGSGSFIRDNKLLAPGGTGGYSSGILFVKRSRKLFLYIGASKNLTHLAEILNSTFNGSPGGYNHFDGVGGGATDFRTKSGKWNENPSSRIIVAGGGGSGRIGTHSGYFELKGGNGGGLTGRSGQGVNCSSPYGTQNQSFIEECNSVFYRHGIFGSGGGGSWAGGGGGWYGGGFIVNGAGGGGSGYIGNLLSFGKYKAQTNQTEHPIGFGRAKITILSNIPMELFCNTPSYSLSNTLLLSVLLYSITLYS
jgi:hypothetical protein